MNKDYLIRGIEKEGKFKFVAVNTTGIANTASDKHQTSKTASAALGRSLSAGALMSTMLKNKDDSLTLIIAGDGMAGNILVSANNKGEIKGYIENPAADLPLNSLGKIDVGGIVGHTGFVKTIIDLGMKEAYVGQSEIISGEIAEDIANYFLTSEQTNTAVALGVLVDRDLSIKESGGYMIQLLPGSSEEDIVKLENSIKNKSSMTELMEKMDSLEEIIAYILEDFQIEVLEKKDLEWKCSCSRERTIETLKALGKDQLQTIIEEDGKAEVVCHFCNEKYDFTKAQLEEILAAIK